MACTLTMMTWGLPLQPAVASQEESGAILSSPAPSPDGRSIAVSANLEQVSARGAAPANPARQEVPFNIWVIPRHGAALRRITDEPEGAMEPAWSPDGRRILASISRDGSWNIWSMSPKGLDARPLTNVSANNREAVWSPDGEQIAFVSDRSGDRRIWIMSRDGSNPRQLSRGPGQDEHPTFSPEGDRVAFSRAHGDRDQLVSVRVTDGVETELTQAAPGIRDLNPSWSRQGLLFASNRPPAAGGHWYPWLIEPGAPARQLMDHPAWEPVFIGPDRLIVVDDVHGPRGRGNADVVGPLVELDVKTGRHHRLFP